MTKNDTTMKKKADQYNDPHHNYKDYWLGRDYEHQAEELALSRFLHDKHFKNAVDIGGGYGRLCVFLEKFAENVTLAEPSQKQLDIAKEFLKDHPHIISLLTQADNLQIPDNSVDLVTMIRVMHHLPDPSAEFKEIARVLTHDGSFILEVANNAHGLNRVRYALKGKRVPMQPVDIRSAAYRNESTIPFVNHNPKTVMRQLAHAGLKVDKVLSVSNLRSATLKRSFSQNTLLMIEKSLQKPLSKTYFGPSIFFLIHKIK